MAKVIIYTKESCAYCLLAKELLSQYKVAFDEFHVDQDPSKLEEMVRLSQRRSVPQIFIDGQSIGGYDDLAALAKSGKLKNLLSK